MGMNLILRAKNEKLEDEYKASGKRLYLNRNYSTLIWGIESWGEECEFNQLQSFYEIDLSPLRTFNYGGLGIHTEEIDGWKDWGLSKTTNEEDISKINSEYEEKLKQAIKKDAFDLENNWVDTRLVKQTIEELIKKIKEQPDKLANLNSHYFTPEHFEMNNQNHKENRYYILNDFEHIINFIDFVESKGENRISFYEA